MFYLNFTDGSRWLCCRTAIIRANSASGNWSWIGPWLCHVHASISVLFRFGWMNRTACLRLQMSSFYATCHSSLTPGRLNVKWTLGGTLTGYQRSDISALMPRILPFSSQLKPVTFHTPPCLFTILLVVCVVSGKTPAVVQQRPLTRPVQGWADCVPVTSFAPYHIFCIGKMFIHKLMWL